jgi:hypothetical protein
MAALCSGQDFATAKNFLRMQGVDSTLARFGRARENVSVRIHEDVLKVGHLEMREQMEFGRVAHEIAVAREQLKAGAPGPFDDPGGVCLAFLRDLATRAEAERVSVFKTKYEEELQSFANVFDGGGGVPITLRPGADLTKLQERVFGGARMAVAADEDQDVVAQVHLKPVSAAGDGQWSRQPRKKVGKAPHCIVTILNLRTGSVLLSLAISKEKLQAAKNAGHKYAYTFCGETFETEYADNECAGLEIALQILVRFVGKSAIRGFVYDCLSARDNLVARYLPDVKSYDDSWHVMNQFRNAIDKVEEAKGQSSLHGLKDVFEPFLLNLVKDKTRSVQEKQQSVRQWQFPGALRAMGQDERQALQKLKDDVCEALKRIKPGFATALVEAFNSTYSRNWEKGQAYCFESFEVRMVLAVLRWNRVLNWPKKVWDAVVCNLVR